MSQENKEVATATFHSVPVVHIDRPLQYGCVRAIMEASSVDPQVLETMLMKLRRVSISMGALIGRALGVEDFCYSFSPATSRIERELEIWWSQSPEQNGPRTSLKFVLNKDGYIKYVGEVCITMDYSDERRIPRGIR